jgi:hypothetical protein
MPVELDVGRHFDFKAFRDAKEKRIVEVGYWLRRRTSIFLLPTRRLQKCRLCKCDPGIRKIVNESFLHEAPAQTLGPRHFREVRIIKMLSPLEYDSLVTSSILFADLFDASANNLVLEAIAYSTPLLINPVGGVVEYLGKEYPFYFQDLDQAANKAEDLQCVKAAHQYLGELPQKTDYSLDNFLHSFVSSEIYQKL